MEDNLRWKMTFDGKKPLMKDDFISNNTKKNPVLNLLLCILKQDRKLKLINCNLTLKGRPNFFTHWALEQRKMENLEICSELSCFVAENVNDSLGTFLVNI